MLGFTPNNSAQANDNIQKLSYDVYASGFHVVEAELTIDYSKQGRYSIVLDAKTRGFLGSLAPWEGSFESHGWVIGDERRPELHRSIAIWRGEKETKSYNYTKDGGFQSLEIKDHDKPLETKKPDPELTQGTSDALSATLQVMEQVFETGMCNGSEEVFDGKRRFKQEFKHVAAWEMKSSRYNIYEGPAAECTIEVTPAGGEWHKKPRGWMSIQEQGRKQGTMPTIWAGSLSPYGPAIPVKIRVKTSYGTLMMHLTEYRSGDDVKMAEKRGDK